ncbi:MAG: trypsin-like peptidase domain-containing protein, partial [Acidimicrobiales bacterium]
AAAASGPAVKSTATTTRKTTTKSAPAPVRVARAAPAPSRAPGGDPDLGAAPAPGNGAGTWAGSAPGVAPDAVSGPSWASPPAPPEAVPPAPPGPPAADGPGGGAVDEPWAPPAGSDRAASPAADAAPPAPPATDGEQFDPAAYAPPVVPGDAPGPSADAANPYENLPAPPASTPPDGPGAWSPSTQTAPNFDPPPGQAGNWSASPSPAPGVGDLAAATAIGGDTISLSIDDDDYTFLPGTEITIGRDPNSLVRLGERHTLVSRNHLRITYHSGSWWIEDQSSKGTFIDGKRITKPYKAEGAFLMSLGDDDAGTTVRVVAPGEHSRPKQGRLVWFALAAVALIVLGIAAVLAASALRDTEDEAASAADLSNAKRATVMLITEEGTLGSGFFVTENLIVTNQHVAAAAPELHVAVSRTADEPAQIEYRATPLALHPYLDIAVLKVTADADGNPIEGTDDISGIPIGNSSELTLGDDVYSTGFPATLSLITSDDMGELQLPPVSTTRGDAASFSIWPGCSNPNQADFIPVGSPPTVTCAPDGDVDRAIVITTFSSGQGASGSPVLRGGEVVAVVFSGPLDEANAGRNIATSAFSDWLSQLIAQEGE